MAVWIALAAVFIALVAVFVPALVRASRQSEQKKRVGGDGPISTGDGGSYGGKSKNDYDGDGSSDGDGGDDDGGGGD